MVDSPPRSASSRSSILSRPTRAPVPAKLRHVAAGRRGGASFVIMQVTLAEIDPCVFGAGADAAPPVVAVLRRTLAAAGEAGRQTLRAIEVVDDWREGSAPFVLLGDGPVKARPTAWETLLWALDADPGLGFATALQRLPGEGGGSPPVDLDVSLRDGLMEWQRRTSGGWPAMLVRRSLLEASDGVPTNSLADCRDGRWKGICVAQPLFEVAAAAGIAAASQGVGEGNEGGWHEAFPQPKPRAPFYRDFRWQPPAWNPLRVPRDRGIDAGRGGGRRVLQILPFLEMGGADKFALDVTEWLQREAGMHVTVVTTDPGANRWLDRMRELTADVFALPSFLPEIEQPTFVSGLIESRQIDTVLVTHSFAGYRMLPYLRARHPRVALLDYLHVEHESWRNGGYPRSSILYREHLDLTITSSGHLRRWVEQRGHRASRLTVCHTNIDARDWRRDPAVAGEVRRRHGVGDDQVLVLFAARMVYQKQPKLLAAIMRRLEQDHPELDFVCLAAGDGEDLPWLERFVRDKDLRRLRLIGARSNAEIKQLLAAADIYLLPSMMEGIALALFEAMAMECVVVAGDVGGQRELVDESSGFLIDRGAGDELGQYVGVLRRVIGDEGLRARVRQQARRRIEDRFSIDHMARDLAAAFDRAHRHRVDEPNAVLSEGVIRHLLAEAAELQRFDAEAAARDAGLKAKYEDRLEKRDQRIARLEAKVATLQERLQDAPRRSLRHRLRDSLRKRLGDDKGPGPVG